MPSEGNRILFKELPNFIKEKISIEKLEKLGPLKWYEIRKKIYNNPRNRNLLTIVYSVLNPTN